MSSIHRHLMVRLSLSLAAGGLLLGIATYLFTRQEMNEVFDEQLKQLAISVRTHYRGGVGAAIGTLAAPGSAADLEDAGMVTQIWSLDRQRVFLSVSAADIPWVAQEGYHTVSTRQGEWRVYTEQSPTHLIQAAQLMATREDLAVDTALEILLPNLIAVLALTALLLAYSLRRGLAPLTLTSSDIERRSAHSLVPIPTAALADELKPLVVSINSLMARLATALSAQSRFTGDAAHELRTPLTALRLQVQLCAKATDEASRQEALRDIQRGLDRATHLVEQLLQLSRLEPETNDRSSRAVDLSALVKSVVTDFSVLANAREIDLGAEIASPTTSPAVVLGDAEHLRILLNNLVDNALRYSSRGGKVDVALRTSGSTVVLEVADSGPGIAPAERQRVFDRFYRGSAAHGVDGATTGTGLGLAIVQEVAQRHGARIDLVEGLSTADGRRGSTFRLTFDKAS